MSRMLHKTLILLLTLQCVLSGQSLAADDKKAGGEGKKEVGTQIAKVVWRDVDKAGALPKSAVIENDDELGEVVKITRTPEVTQLIELAKIEKPPVTLRAYLLRGKVKFSGVGGEGFLEIWNHFPEPKKGAYFSRTMAESGPMGKLRGDSPWREFALPFNFDDPTYPMPEMIQFNVYMPQSGTVWLSQLELVELKPSELSSQLSSAATPSRFVYAAIGLVLVFIVATAMIIGALSWMRMNSKRVQGIELRRMQALDIG